MYIQFYQRSVQNFINQEQIQLICGVFFWGEGGYAKIIIISRVDENIIVTIKMRNNFSYP